MIETPEKFHNYNLEQESGNFVENIIFGGTINLNNLTPEIAKLICLPTSYKN